MKTSQHRNTAGIAPATLFASIALAAVSAASAATTSSITVADISSGRNAYSTAWKWTGGVAPANDSDKKFDFVVANGYDVFLPDTHVALTFGGNSVQFGASDFSSAGTLYIKGNNRWVTFPDLRLYKGLFSPAQNGAVGFNGNATVYSTAEDPFNFLMRLDYDSYFNLVFTGGDTSAVKFSGAYAKKSPIILYADQSATYSGSWIIGENVEIRPSYNASYGSIRTSAQAFGKAPATFNPKGIVLQSGSTLRYEAANRAFLSSDNRGLWLDAEGSSATYVLLNGANHAFGWPIGGAGTFQLIGSGAFYLSSECAVPLSVTQAVSLHLLSGAAVTDGLSSVNPVAATVTVSADGTSSTPIRLGGTFDVPGPIAVALSQIPSVASTTDIPVFVIDRASASQFTEADFDPWGVAGAQTANADSIIFSTDGNGDTVVSVRVFPFARSNASAGAIVTMDNSGQWMPAGIPSAGGNYIVWNNNLRTGGADLQNPYNVQGGRFVLFNPSGTTYYDYQSKHYRTVFPFLRLLDDTGFVPGHSRADWTLALGGRVDVRTSRSKYARLCANSDNTRLDATLSGRGNLLLFPYNGLFLEMAGDASAFVGRVIASNYLDAATSTLKASSEANFGGNPETFAEDAWLLCANVKFAPTADVVFDDPNRGVTLADGSSVDTTSGDFTVETPVVIAGAFAKNGDGTFAYGAGGATVASGAAISVNGGAIKVQHADGLKGASVSFADGAMLAVDVGPDSPVLDLATTTLSKEGAQYLVRIDRNANDDGAPRAIMTFADAASAEAFVANAKTVRGTGIKGELIVDGVVVKCGSTPFVLVVR
ncbi:MAG: hypothetical protein IJK04_16670 [Kiritimatiellae bacterium]|nr:hypothetical protein [Kiritimatiellia bacterium]